MAFPVILNKAFPCISISLNSNFFVVQGSSVGYIKATDPENDPLRFSLDPASQDLLQIDNSGNLTLKAPLDREVGHVSLFQETKRDRKFWVRLSNIEALFIWQWQVQDEREIWFLQEESNLRPLGLLC